MNKQNVFRLRGRGQRKGKSMVWREWSERQGRVGWKQNINLKKIYIYIKDSCQYLTPRLPVNRSYSEGKFHMLIEIIMFGIWNEWK